MRYNVDILGDEALAKIIGGLEKKVAGKVLRPALRKAAKAIRVAAIAAAPRLTGATAMHVVVKGASSKGMISVHVRTGKRSEMAIPGDAKYYYPAAVELGTERMPARPWLRPTLEAQRAGALETIASEAWARIEKLGLGTDPGNDED